MVLIKPGIWTRVAILVTTGLTTAAIMSAPVADAATPTCFGRKATIVGTAHRDVLRGTPKRDVMVGLGGNDTINGLGGDDILCGGPGNDKLDGGNGGDPYLSGGPGNDKIQGGPGRDGVFYMLGGPGDDVIDGGKGFDLASFHFAPGPVTVNLEAGTATGEGKDKMIGVEDLEGSKFDDTLTGDAGENFFWPGPGNDTVDGGGGSTDLVVFQFSPNPVTADLTLGTATGDGNDTLRGIEGLDGSKFDDTLTGDAGPNQLFGRKGNDTLMGGAGDDEIVAGPDNDTLDGGDGIDTLDGGDGTDTCRNGETVVNCEA